MTLYEQLRKKIIKAVPEIEEMATNNANNSGLGVSEWKSFVRELTLEDVLIAIPNKKHIYFRSDGAFFKWEKFNDGGSGHHGVESTYVEWNYGKPLSDQSEETLKFINDILKVDSNS